MVQQIKEILRSWPPNWVFFVGYGIACAIAWVIYENAQSAALERNQMRAEIVALRENISAIRESINARLIPGEQLARRTDVERLEERVHQLETRGRR
jgi:hypothetical protein